MRDLVEKQRQWLVDELAKKGRGARKALAERLGIRQDAITRMTNFDGRKEIREISNAELNGMAEFFHSIPPGLRRPRPVRPEANLVQVPHIDRVTAGKLRSPAAQIPMDDFPLITFSDLGRGDFFALTVEGDSVDRVSPDGSVIIVNAADRQLISGKFYVFSLKGETTYKMWQGGENAHLAPYSTNPSNKPIFFKRKRDVEVIGRVKRTLLDL